MMKKTTMSNNNNGVSKILIIVVVAVVIIAAAGAVLYYIGKENSAEINFQVNGVATNDSDIFVYLEDTEIYKKEVKGSMEFTITGTAFYGISANETKEITLYSKIVKKDGEVVHTISKVFTVTGSEKYQIDLSYFTTTVESTLTIELSADAMVTVSTDGVVFGTHSVKAYSKERFKDSIKMTVSESGGIVVIDVEIKYFDGKVEYVEAGANIDVGHVTEVKINIDRT